MVFGLFWVLIFTNTNFLLRPELGHNRHIVGHGIIMLSNIWNWKNNKLSQGQKCVENNSPEADISLDSMICWTSSKALRHKGMNAHTLLEWCEQSRQKTLAKQLFRHSYAHEMRLLLDVRSGEWVSRLHCIRNMPAARFPGIASCCCPHWIAVYLWAGRSKVGWCCVPRSGSAGSRWAKSFSQS